tara:strand:+ start:11072 stop:12061 length:990 start_codon:yes stop_codon:yes gene_type:complete
MALVNKFFLSTIVTYFLLFFGFLFYQIIQIYLKGVHHIPSSMYLLSLQGLSPISVSTEPIYFIIAHSLKAVLPLESVLPIISQIIFGSLLYMFLKIAEPFSNEKKKLILILAAFSFITISNSEAIIRQGLGMIFFSVFLFSEYRIKWLYLILAILSHNVFGIVAVFFILSELVLKIRINIKSITAFFLLVFLSLYIQKILYWLSEITNRTAYLDYSRAVIDFKYQFLAAMLFCGLLAGFHYFNQKNIAIRLISWKILVLTFSIIVMQFAFSGFPFIDRLIYIPLIYLPFLICMFSIRPKFFAYIGYASFIVVNLIYMLNKTSVACEPYC